MNSKNETKYAQYVKRRAKRSPIGKNCAKAFSVGGLICALAQGICLSYQAMGAQEETARLLTSCTVIFLTAVLTGIGVFDVIAKHAGAGTLVPISGFANAMVAPAMDSRHEGMIFGVGAKTFTIAGPVILYGTLASVMYGLFLLLMNGIGG